MIDADWRPDSQRDLYAVLARAGAYADLWRSRAALFADTVAEPVGLRRLADEPQAAWRHADLAAALVAAPVVGRIPAAMPFYELL